jgi:uncharacterized membrane protein YeaQ/YmgE (transglycosylase-associated protein family)
MGATLGWLAAIVLQLDNRDGIARNVGAGMVGALVTGTLVNAGSVLHGISAVALLLAILGAGVLITFANAVRLKA